MTFSPWDLPLLSDANKYSNFQCFLESVTPTIPSKRLSMGHLRLLRIEKLSLRRQILTVSIFQRNIPQSLGKDIVECFSLSSLWKFYTERSVYGAGVPILLNNGDSCLQYYCPSLSALQIYIKKPTVSLGREGKSGTEKQERGSLSDKSEKDGLSITLSNNSSKSLDVTSDETSGTGHDDSCQTSDPFGDLYCQYNETTSPYDRIPLIEKINELAKEYPGLLKFCSTNLSSYSWIAIAWYPIYQIPLTRNVRELSACFVTFHRLSSSKDNILEEQNKKIPFINCSEKEQSGGVSRRLKEEKDSDERSEIAVPPFAAATYKMNGDLWMNPTTSDQEKIASYLDAARSWLKFLNFEHHDFHFFMSRRRS